ncbi:2-keto-4-pentenoate hydratase/2-oxohepta-3-ene-1,7-dioic acid hydratase (Catechol pathway) [Paraburkholderia unamae]|uniref:fumarylacetoacetate hydrolase family protein n=1 Tax=Paraburkholderia unamae TaxID=219649 RepID=UPI001CB55906|nr:fumarylacetoacetate hydrolase family protein [Paraburkholderia unamae]CAG9271572.1 2-keto-4-pentenoate hydratase/2-oxohepta-3-ene-1,7-dioic acid hydratase (Catechol pathway) [Paraburkholderia unamae]
MQLLSFRDRVTAAIGIGIVRDTDRVIDVARSAAALGLTLPFDATDMVSLIAAGAAARTALDDLVHRAAEDLPLAALELVAPVPSPRKNIFCVGWNYLEHFAEGAKIRPHVKDMPEFPTFFTKAPTTICGPYDPIPYFAELSAQLDWEVELAVVIGTAGRDIAKEDAMEHVFGFTALNDLSWRDIQRRHGQQWFKGKSIDGTCPMGPWIVTCDALDPRGLDLVTRVNGLVKQSSNTRCMYFDIPTIIAELSRGLTLEAGDIIATGTPPGVGHARTPPEFMHPGDVLETEVAGVGVLRNPIGA